MNIKNNKGVTITVLVLTIIIMLILFGITFSSATDLLRNSQKNKMKTMLYMVQSRAQILLDDFLFENDGGDEATTKTQINGLDSGEIQEALKGTYIENITDLKNVGYELGNDALPEKSVRIYCSWNEQTLTDQGIDTKNLAEGDTIIIQYNISEDSVEVASTKGFSEDGVSIHKLGEFSD